MNKSSVKRMLSSLVSAGKVEVTGKARATRYRLRPTDAPVVGEQVEKQVPAVAKSPGVGPRWRTASLQLRQQLTMPLAARTPVTYRREFVDDYKPNETFLLPPELADELVALGRLPGQLPAGTYARKVLEQLLIDLSWSSSRLEGNRYTLLDTEELFKAALPLPTAMLSCCSITKLPLSSLWMLFPYKGSTPVWFAMYTPYSCMTC
ncbi:hypothetical protein [Massilia pseudoviolaceinigra]|uniref:hypothetical protein n=1 Tax=Massilia pseudoviolaceinigra TaxID=3057165 RepID=UPI002796C7A9|nr:hypothetical protein [Massilia sp. CCM 9206]MDQ1920470.1 hypothetical protein [Massilia sp. CCM 9206]